MFGLGIRFYIAVCFVATDVAFKDGKIGDYLFLGNMVYTVSELWCTF